MTTPPASYRVVHVSEQEDDSRLLQAQLTRDGLAFEVSRVASSEAFWDAISSDVVHLVIADLPLPWPAAHDDLAAIQRSRPEIEVIFRWGESGARSVEGELEQLERLVNQRLAQSETRPQSDEERRAAIHELARRQEALLKLQRMPTWDFEEVLRETTRIAAQVLEVERVSVWEFGHDRSRLECLLLFKRTPGEYERGQVLSSHENYFRALESSLAIAAHDSRRDPRTSEFTDDYLVPLGIPSMLDAPIRLDGKVAGVLCLEHVGEPRHWTVLDQCASATLACFLARAFEIRRRRDAEQRAQASERMHALGELTAQLAHDFNNRLTVISAWAWQIGNQLPPGSVAEHYVHELNAEIGKAADHVREMLALGRGRPATTRRAADLAKVIREQARTMHGLLGAAVDLEIQVSDEPAWVALGERELESIVLNLCSNARDASRDLRHVRVSVAQAERGSTDIVRWTFEDDGPGFEPATLARLFQPLYTTKPPERGSGLGLASVRRLVVDAGGEIRASNRQPRGARVEIDLPRADAPEQPVSA